MNLKEWLQKIREYSDENVRVALVGNKKDLVEETTESMKKIFEKYYNDDDEENKEETKNDA